MNNSHAIVDILPVDIRAYLFHKYSPSGKEIGRSPVFNSKMVQFWTFFNLTNNPEKQGDQLFLILLIMVHISSRIFYHMIECLYVSPISKSEFLPAPMQLNLK